MSSGEVTISSDDVTIGSGELITGSGWGAKRPSSYCGVCAGESPFGADDSFEGVSIRTGDSGILGEVTAFGSFARPVRPRPFKLSEDGDLEVPLPLSAELLPREKSDEMRLACLFSIIIQILWLSFEEMQEPGVC